MAKVFQKWEQNLSNGRRLARSSIPSNSFERNSCWLVWRIAPAHTTPVHRGDASLALNATATGYLPRRRS
jgi:hypothetical protein